MATNPPIQENAPISARRLWFGLVTPAVAWASLGILDLLVTWRACVHREEFANAKSDPTATLVFIGIAVLLFATLVIAGVMSYRNWRSISGESKILQTNATDRREFMALLGVFISLTLGVGVLWLSLPPLMIELCARAR